MFEHTRTVFYSIIAYGFSSLSILCGLLCKELSESTRIQEWTLCTRAILNEIDYDFLKLKELQMLLHFHIDKLRIEILSVFQKIYFTKFWSF